MRSSRCHIARTLASKTSLVEIIRRVSSADNALRRLRDPNNATTRTSGTNSTSRLHALQDRNEEYRTARFRFVYPPRSRPRLFLFWSTIYDMRRRNAMKKRATRAGGYDPAHLPPQSGRSPPRGWECASIHLHTVKELRGRPAIRYTFTDGAYGLITEPAFSSEGSAARSGIVFAIATYAGRAISAGAGMTTANFSRKKKHGLPIYARAKSDRRKNILHRSPRDRLMVEAPEACDRRGLKMRTELSAPPWSSPVVDMSTRFSTPTWAVTITEYEEGGKSERPNLLRNTYGLWTLRKYRAQLYPEHPGDGGVSRPAPFHMGAGKMGCEDARPKTDTNLSS